MDMDNQMNNSNYNPNDQVPLEGLMVAQAPNFKKGDSVTLLVDHVMAHMVMKMKGAPATIVAGYNTRAYAVDFYTTNDHTLVKDHKWIIQREIKGETDDSPALSIGSKITIEANHMPGMRGAEATIVDSQEGNIYIVDVPAYEGQKPMMNHRWFMQDEMKPRN
ncbi:DUF1541 domain-containing protein [Lentilactobacillus laojiaonis]|uniref:DUF1541 domain-containing protein n=1 Tax=Lentilactobacillus laojiaonis TaxID=2883998 RepID=UPI001D09B480|nr:DUF1541 domain-containing protein [Lentilactobacillus laojiaonis]UDM31896.1 YdhK family protein [Lentilactobacillus laojiaonis]